MAPTGCGLANVAALRVYPDRIMIVSHGIASISGADLCASRCPQGAHVSVSRSYHNRISAYQRVSARITSQAARMTCGDLGDVRALVSHGTTYVSALYHATVSAYRIMRYQRAYHGCGITFVSDGIRNRSVSGAYRERIGCQYRECGIDVEL